ncbi:MAG: hypothetical protein R3E08_02750 [Thiotrichaceae bacterium]
MHEAVQAIKAGAAEYLVKPIDLDELEVTIKRVLENAAMRQDYQFIVPIPKNQQRTKTMVSSHRYRDEKGARTHSRGCPNRYERFDSRGKAGWQGISRSRNSPLE